jgi:hypothetical protein
MIGINPRKNLMELRSRPAALAASLAAFTFGAVCAEFILIIKIASACFAENAVPALDVPARKRTGVL